MKSLKTQFIAAIAMVLVAAVAMGSSTFAWFAINNKVEAKSVNIQVKTAETLAIAADASDAWKTNNNYGTLFTETDDLDDIEPVVVTSASHAATLSAESVAGTNQTSVEFYTLTAANQPTKVDNATTGVTTIAQANAVASPDAFSNYYTQDSASTNYTSNHFHIAYFAAADQQKDLKVKITVTKADAAFSKTSVDGALHVGLLVKYGNTSKFYNYDMSNDNVNTSVGNTAVYAPTTAIVRLNGVKDAAQTADQAKIADITAYVWYEGEDAQCYTLAALSPQNMTVDLAFETVDVPQP